LIEVKHRTLLLTRPLPLKWDKRRRLSGAPSAAFDPDQ